MLIKLAALLIQLSKRIAEELADINAERRDLVRSLHQADVDKAAAAYADRLERIGKRKGRRDARANELQSKLNNNMRQVQACGKLLKALDD